MEVSPQEIKDLKASLHRVHILGQEIARLSEERAREIDLIDRRVSFLSHPAGKGRKETLTPNDILMFKKEK